MSKTRSDSLSVPETFRKSAFSEKIALVLATWFGCGLAPLASGTVGTLAAVPLIHGLNSLGIRSSVFMLLIAVVIAVWSSDQTQALLKKKDPSEVVVDEVAWLFCHTPVCLFVWVFFCSDFLTF